MTSPTRPTVVLALDVGDARVGVAISRSGVIAEPLTTLECRGKRALLDAIEKLVTEHNVGICVLGLPLLEGGAEGEQSAKTRAFGRSLARRLPRLALAFQDERHTSADARTIAGRRAAPGAPKGVIDRIAAALILQAWLDDQPAKPLDQPRTTAP